MAKMVGLNVSLRMGWMKKAVELLGKGLSEEEYKNELKEFLAYEIDSPTNLRKAKDNLTFIWFRDSDQYAYLQQEGRRLAQQFPEYISAIGWCMVPMTYPVFYDLAKLMGKMFEFEETITTGQIRKKMFDEWGERSTLDYSTGKIIAAMKSLEAVESPATGKYVVNKQTVKEEKIISFMLRSAMTLDGSSYYTYESLSDFPFLFPFSYRITKELLMADDRFVLSTFDATLTVSLKNDN